MTTSERRLNKWLWAKANPEKVKAAVKRWRELNKARVRQKAAERMRRWRARQNNPAP